MEPEAIIWTEGKTDWQQMKHAFAVLGVGSRVSFQEHKEDFGDDQLLKQCVATARIQQRRPTIFVFDRDNEEIIGKIQPSGSQFKAWGNDVYSFALPVPAHRSSMRSISIEFYYTDAELRTVDEQGRRLFLSSEFNTKSGRHLIDQRLSVGNKKRLPPSDVLKIVDSDVFDEQSRSVALSKGDFALNVTTGVGAFGAITFEAFREILKVVDAIVDQSRGTLDLPFGDLDSFISEIAGLEPHQQLGAVADVAVRICKLAALVFGATTFRYYEQRIIRESPADIKKVRPVKHLLAESFGQPSLTTLQKLARYSYHLIDEHAPVAICTLRAMMSANPQLGAVGDLLERLETALPAARQGRVLNKRDLKRPVLEFVLSEFAKYDGRMSEIIENAAGTDALRNVDANTWRTALLSLTEMFSPLRTLVLGVRTIQRVQTQTDEFDVLCTTYRNGRKSVEELTQKLEDLADDRLETYELVTDDPGIDGRLDLFPFVIIKDDRLYSYNRTRSQGYEYIRTFGHVAHVIPTKRKFSYVALRQMLAADLQGIFWTQVTPSVSDTGVKGNIPAQAGPMVGRKQQIVSILDEVIEIVNQNGIIYGPGGVGKTALLIELSRQLADGDPAKYFKNIIWVSAKRDLYDPSLDAIESRSPQFRSLDNVLTAVLEFHGFEDAAGYDVSDKKWLVLESLRDEKTLLILDNFESIARAGQEEILEFFGLEAKKRLRDKPEYLKVLITSRELIPSGFHQIQLKGLDKRESKELMQRLDEQYAHAGQPLLGAEQRDSLYDATRGIPLIIKHCYGQIYEFNKPAYQVFSGLSGAGAKVVDFSFSELFQELKQDDLQLRAILLLELIGHPLMLRQMADILGVAEAAVADRLARLVNFQCANRLSTGAEEKYVVSDEVRLFTRRLTQEFAELSTAIKSQIANLSIEKRMDYSREEFDALVVFQGYIGQGHYVLAEDFIKERLKQHPQSLLLNLHYAMYLKDVKRRTDEAIERLEGIRVASGNDQQVLMLLMAYYSQLEFPNFEQAHGYARELEDVAKYSEEIKWELAKFYAGWSTAIKMKVDLDPLKEILRQQKYKELADTAIRVLNEIQMRTHEWHHLLAQSYFNSWDYDNALRHIERAVDMLPKQSHLLQPYRRLRGSIIKKKAQYAEWHVEKEAENATGRW